MDRLQQTESILRDAFAEFGTGAVVLTSFQREGVVIIDIARRIEPHCRVLTLDTGMLPAATHEMIRAVEDRFEVAVERIVPDAAEVQSMIALYGEPLFRDSVAGRRLCCDIRKVRPLARHAAGVSATFVGLRRAQSSSRKDIPVVDRGQHPVKISPLAEWGASDVLQYTRDANLPEHPLYSQGYTSIGCGPCTRAVSPGEDERAGRWWWENETGPAGHAIDKECGLHFSADGKVLRTIDVMLQDVLAGPLAGNSKAR